MTAGFWLAFPKKGPETPLAKAKRFAKNAVVDARAVGEAEDAIDALQLLESAIGSLVKARLALKGK